MLEIENLNSISNISLKTINDLLLDENGDSLIYFIPSYQRGYRWTELEVTLLLEDILEFEQRENPQPEEFYCLQPLVLKARKVKGYEVVDGQQRLTTILLILTYLNSRFAENFRKKIYSISFESRTDFSNFISDPSEKTSQTNIDFHHLFRAISAIKDWFDKHSNFTNDIESALLNKTKIIWFELGKKDHAIEAFTRLNVGKIPLTDDELIRALFLRKLKDRDTLKEAEALQLQIATEWDQMEKNLQQADFWGFLSNDSSHVGNRIGFIFLHAVSNYIALEDTGNQSSRKIFQFYSECLNDNTEDSLMQLKTEWLKIRQAYLTLEEWFEDSTLFHTIGFLIAQGMQTQDIKSLSTELKKNEFDRRLRAEIFKRITGQELPNEDSKVEAIVLEAVSELQYTNRAKIRSVLLLFNIATLLSHKKSNMRFQFDSFKALEWDIEHIRSVSDDKPSRTEDKNNWLKDAFAYFNTRLDQEEICEQINSYLNSEKTTLDQRKLANEFDHLYDEVLKRVGEVDEEPDLSLANLTLLDQTTNRGYKNSIFAVKRKKLLELDQAGIFVPLCTRNVFLKCYSGGVDNLTTWSVKDRDDYLEVINNTLTIFFTKTIT